MLLCVTERERETERERQRKKVWVGKRERERERVIDSLERESVIVCDWVIERELVIVCREKVLLRMTQREISVCGKEKEYVKAESRESE